jgi:hypothetical protein
MVPMVCGARLSTEIERIMELSPVTLPLFLSQTVNLLVTVIWLALMGIALALLRRSSISDEAKALWAGLIVIIPFLGAVAFWVVAPGRPVPQAQSKRVPMLSGPTEEAGRWAGGEGKGVEFGQAVQWRSPT